MIETVNGKINASQIGKSLAHEHVLCDLRPSLVHNEQTDLFKQKISISNRWAIYSDPYVLEDNAFYLDEEVAIRELKTYKKAGGDTIFDCTTFFPNCIENRQSLKRISSESGVNIVLGCGFYIDDYLTNKERALSVTERAQKMIKELTVGFEGNDFKAGFIGEIGTSADVTDDEWKNIQAAGIASKETGAAIHFHTALWEENGLEICEFLIKDGVSPEKICIDHLDVNIREWYIEKLLDMGVYVEFDNFGKEFFIPKRDTGVLRGRFAYDYERCQTIYKLVKKGFADKIFITNDICLKSMLCEYGGNGFAHIVNNIVPMLKDVGVSEKDIDTMLMSNCAKFFDK